MVDKMVAHQGCAVLEAISDGIDERRDDFRTLPHLIECLEWFSRQIADERQMSGWTNSLTRLIAELKRDVCEAVPRLKAIQERVELLIDLLDEEEEKQATDY